MRGITITLAILAVVATAATTEAGSILSPIDVVGNTMGTAGGSEANLYNQTGLSAGFVSGVTDFDAYLAGAPTHATNSGSNAWAGNPGPTLGYLDFDLGEIYSVDRFVLWTQSNANAVNRFELYVSDDAAFTGATFVGGFGASVGTSAQVYGMGGADGRYVRLNVLSNHGGGNVNIGEVAFDVNPVPEPATLALFGLGALGFAIRRRRRVA